MSPALHSAHIALLNAQSRLPTVAHLFVVAAVVVTKWDMRRRTRKSLSQLEPHLLSDIGLTEGRAKTEAGKPFWQG